jgi:murein L,D-transpeptidase YafK
MTDVDCIREAIKEIGAQEIKVTNSQIQLRVNGKQWNLNKQVGRYVLSHYDDENVSWVNKLTDAYSNAETRKAEELRKERERQSRMRIEASKALAAAKAAKIEGMAKEELAKLKLHHEEKQAELVAQMSRMKTLESEFASIKQQKKELAEARATEIVKRAKKSNWNVANPVQKNGKIRIDMTR